MTDAEKERARCEQIVINAIKRNKDVPLVASKLKLVLQKIRRSRSTGTNGGPSPAQLALPFDNSTNANQSTTT